MRLIEHTPKRWADFIKSRNPITESIVPLNHQGKRALSIMTDRWLVVLARWKFSNQKFKGRRELQKADPALYQALSKRKLQDRLEFEEKRRNFSAMGDGELIGVARAFIAEKGINGRTELHNADLGLYNALRGRRLLDAVGIKDLRGKTRNWAGMGDEELVDLARAFIAENGVNKRKELREADRGLYNVLRRRNLLIIAGLEQRLRHWAAMSDEKLVEFAKGFITDHGIEGREELAKADLGLYKALQKRKLVNGIGLEVKQRNWVAMSDQELIGFAKAFNCNNEIKGKGELRKADVGLYDVLRRRKVLDEVFSDVDQQKHAEAVQGVLDALESFGDDP